MPAWEKALSTIGGSAFLQGENDRGWRADLDFICQEKSWRKLQEGSYSRGQVTEPEKPQGSGQYVMGQIRGML